MIKKIFNALIINKRKEIPFIIFFFFLVSFFFSRIIAHAIHRDAVPEFLFFIKNVYVKGYHIHHFNFGIIIMALAGFLSLVDAARSHIRISAALYGIGLGLITDEFGMLITFQDVYWTSRLGYDAVMITALVLLNIVYFGKFWKVMGGKIKRLIGFTHRSVISL